MQKILASLLFFSTLCPAATAFLSGHIEATSNLFNIGSPEEFIDPDTGEPLYGPVNYSYNCSESRSGASVSASCHDDFGIPSPDGSGNVWIDVSLSGDVTPMAGNVFISSMMGGSPLGFYVGWSGGGGSFSLDVEGKYLFLGAKGSHAVYVPNVLGGTFEGHYACTITLNGISTQCESGEFITVPFGVPVDFKLSAAGYAWGSGGNWDVARASYDLSQVWSDVEGIRFTPVPEPQTCFMMIVALAAFIGRVKLR